MDHESLRTASTYLNNLLLARGLLRNSEPVDFVKPSKESRAQIINLVHDLILRQDRDKLTQEQSADTLRALRADEQRRALEFERVSSKAEESARAAVAARNGERTAQAEVKKVERALKAAQEQASKLRTALAQVKTQCANDVRKRDLELARLKTHLQGQQRGKSVGAAGPSLTVKNATSEKRAGSQKQHYLDRALADPEYSLKQETTEFLTELSQSLSDENDALIGLIRNALTTMRELLGLPADGRAHPDSAIGSVDSEESARHADNNNNNNNNKQRKSKPALHALPTSFDALSGDMDTALAHLKDLLTTPNYVAIEEVELREDEIARLRAGWERMEQRWREVLHMMEGWRQRMDTGDTINMDEIRRGIGLVSPASRRERADGDDLPEPEQSFLSADVSDIRVDGASESSVLFAQSSSPAKGGSSNPAKRKRDVLEPPDFFNLRPLSATSSKRRLTAESRETSLPAATPDADMDGSEHEGVESEDAEMPQMTVEEKLSAAQAEAEEVAAAAAAAARASSIPVAVAKTAPPHGLSSGSCERTDDTLGKMPNPMAKRTRIKGRPRKRKSTLSPDELEALITADAGL